MHTKTMKKLTLAAAVLVCCACTTADPAVKYPNMVANIEPFSVGTAHAAFDKLLSSKPKPAAIDVVFYPRHNTVALEFRYELISYRQFWDQAARRHFAESLKLYKNDFNSKTLIGRYSKSRGAYGRVRAKLEWESFKFSTTYRSSPVIDVGYRFRDSGDGSTPFFALSMRSAKDQTVRDGDRPPNDSSSIAIYFTIRQAEQLAGLFDQAFLLEQAGVSGEEPIAAQSEELERDIY